VDSTTQDLPSKWQNGIHRADEHLHLLLTTVGAADADIQAMTCRSQLTVGCVSGLLGHVLTKALQSEDATDVAWSEADVWAVDLRLVSIQGEEKIIKACC